MRNLFRRGCQWGYQQIKASVPSSWDLCQAYIKVDPSVIVGPHASVEVKYRPLHPGVCIEIGQESQVFGNLIIQRPGASIKIGRRTQIGASSLIAAEGIEVGDDVLMAWGITIMDNDSHSLTWDDRKGDVIQCGIDYQGTPEDFARNKNWSTVKIGPVRIEPKAWIGFGSVILKGVTVGEGAAIGAASVVTRDVPAYTLVAGNPARVIRSLLSGEKG